MATLEDKLTETKQKIVKPAQHVTQLLRPWALAAGVVLAVLYLVESYFYNVPSFSADQAALYTSALLIWAGK